MKFAPTKLCPIRERRGVGAIIGGVILAAILVTTVLVYFLTILNNDKAKTSYEMAAAQANQDKATEKYSIEREHDLIISGGSRYIRIHIDNDGPIPLTYSHILVYCITASCSSTNPIEYTGLVTLNAGESTDDLAATLNGIDVGPVTNGLKYRVDVISERGNIVSAIECEVNGNICEDPAPPGSGGNPGAIPVGIIQGTGSLQLDFPSFGALLPDYKARNGVDQTGWLTKSGNATGYPAFMLPAGPKVYLVERIRNLDEKGYDINLGRSSGMTISQGKCTSGQCPPVYLCKSDFTAATVNASPLTDVTGNPSSFVTIPATPQTAGRYDGWQDIMLCAANQGSTSPWNVQAQMTNINSAFMVSRGVYGGTNFAYAQTIPYQSIVVANLGSINYGNSGVVLPAMDACLIDLYTRNTSCGNPTDVASPTFAKYQGAAGTTVAVRVENGCDCPYNVSWIYPKSGAVVNLVSNAALTSPSGTGNINQQITIPSTMPDGSPLVTNTYYTIMLSTGYSGPDAGNNYNQGVYYFTFMVT